MGKLPRKFKGRIHIMRTNISCQFVGNNQLFIQGFCDASESAYGACIYVQSVNNCQDKISSRLLCSKARVAPLKKQTVPRLELCSALLLAKLLDNVKKAIRVNIDGIYAWSDSMVVPHWLRGDTSRWKPFVYNRVAEILEILPASQWNHVKSSENPADLISRGATPAQLKDSSLWNGPEWLLSIRQSTNHEESNWELNEEDLASVEFESKGEVRCCNVNAQQASSCGEAIAKLIERCSTLTKIERSLAYCIRFVSNCRKKGENRITRLTLSEITTAHMELIKHSQLIYFPDDIKDLRVKGELRQSSQLSQLQAFLDKDGVLRVGGRLQETPWTFERKHPILLSGQCKITRLLIEREHRVLLHASQQLLLSVIRQSYWPLNARSNIVR
ncbi:uncharacterized protein LOC113004887 [Solenopsis invicta]|uniref:uncharacterized protein LOC113004887 n=1 Tax=Solenopsis invicta TaxID=13686 RepID=UPI000E33F13B|nr:uncharacterized protein LOC113004887 [Solenopsis invicta]